MVTFVRLVRSFALTLPLIVAHSAAQAQTKQPPQRQQPTQPQQPPRIAEVPELADFAERWKAALASLDVPGFSIAVVKDGKVLALDAFGVRNVAGDPATPDTCYYIASATKPFTALGVCLLAADGKVDLDAPVEKYLPPMRLPDERLTHDLSVRDLLCHRHGLNSMPIVHRDAYTGQITDDIYFRLLRDAEIAHQVRYSNVHFTLAGRVIEAAGGAKWQDYLDRRVFDPLGMASTTAYASEMYGQPDHAEPMLLIDGRWQASVLRKTDRTMHAAGGMGTTARDAARWLLFNIQRGEIDGRRLLPENLAREFFSKQADHPQPRGSIRIEEGFALGWNIGKYRDQSRPYFFHGGGYTGAASYFCFLPNEGIGVAVLANSDGGGAIATIASIDVLDRLLGVKDQNDLLPVYAEEAARRRASAPKAPEGVNPASAPEGLTQPAARYLGTFSNATLGEVEVLMNDRGELAARMGDMPLTLVSRGADRFIGFVVPGMTLEGSFEIGGESQVAALVLAFPGTPQRFDRVK